MRITYRLNLNVGIALTYFALGSFWLIKTLLISALQYKLRLQRQSLKTRQEDIPTDFFPNVCVQLPLYCEPDHVQGLLFSVAKLNWPKHRLEIQVLDDSTDQTPEIACKTIATIQRQDPALKITHLRRSRREGYKAGALNYGMGKTQADYFAIFDCDFRPDPDFLTSTMGRFKNNSKLAAVQGAWIYQNASENWLTLIQRMMLNLHFFVEQNGRYQAGLPFNFNGTAGIWSRRALEDLGGWSSRTVTEDLYLSYQAQMKGWQIEFDSQVRCKSELPATFDSFLIQQRRWSKGNGQTLRLLWQGIWRSSWTNKAKLDATFHLLGYAMAGVISLLYVLIPFWIPLREQWIGSTDALSPTRIIDTIVWGVLLGSFLRLYTSQQVFEEDFLPLRARVWQSLMLLGLSPLIAVLTLKSYTEGLFCKPQGRQLVFNRTPKSFKPRRRANWDHAVSFIVLLYFMVSSSLALVHDQPLFSLVLALHGAVVTTFLIRILPIETHGKTVVENQTADIRVSAYLAANES